MKSLIYAGVLGAALLATPALAAVDPCRLLTTEQVQAATRVRVAAPVADTATSAQIGKCKFLHADTSFGHSIVASVAAYKPDRVESQRRMWTTFMRMTPVPGVGDFAYFNEAGGVLMAGRGDKAVQIQMLDGPAGAARLEAMKTLAREALAKL